jgi:hypothetical protein
MKEEILARVTGRTPQVRLGYEKIESYFPELDDLIVDQMLTVVVEAWNTLTEMCVMCPTRCISERDRRASMFDDPESWK